MHGDAREERAADGAVDRARRCARLRVAAPRDVARRGGTVAFDVPHGAEVAQALLARDVVIDYRPGRGHPRRTALLHVRRRGRTRGR